MRDRLVAALGEQAVLIFAADGDAIARVEAAARTGPLVLLLIEDSVSNLDRTMLLSALGPLSVALAPSRRIAALDLAAGADVEDVLASALFLSSANSTTGQALRITPRG